MPYTGARKRRTPAGQTLRGSFVLRRWWLFDDSRGVGVAVLVAVQLKLSMGASKPATYRRFKTSQGLIVQSTCFSSLGEPVRVNL
jgi:hypothetical protein